MKSLMICIGLLCSHFVDIYGLQRVNSSPLILLPREHRAVTSSDSINFDDLYPSDIQSLSTDEEKMRAYLRDGEKIRVVVQILEKELGYTELDGRKVIDISYPSLMAYVRRLRDSDRYSPHVFQITESIDQSLGEDLYQQAVEILFDLSELSSGLVKKFNRLFLKMISVTTGEQRIKSLCVLQTLINNQIGYLGNSYYLGKKTKIKKSSDRSSAYCPLEGELVLQASEGEIHYLQRMDDGRGQSPQISFIEDLSETMLHELTHLNHYMLRLNDASRIDESDLTNSVRAAYIPDPLLREHLIPLLNKDFFMDVLQRMQSSDLGADLKYDYSEMLEYEPNYRFLSANQFFGNELLAMSAELPFEERKIIAALGDMICDFINGWDNFEEMLTIMGFAPVKLIDKTYLIVDRQNENVQSIRGQNRFRLTHAVSFLLSHFETKGKDFLQIFSEAMQSHNLYVYRSQSEMPQTPSEFYLSTPAVAFGEGATATSINECLQYYLSEGVRFKAEPGSETFCYVGDIAEYGVISGAKVTPETLELCIRKGALPDSVIDNLLQGSANKRNEVMQLIKQFPNEEFIQVVLDYSRKNAINLCELPEFVAFIDHKIEECTHSRAAAKILWPILSYATDHELVIPKLNNDFQRILGYSIDNNDSIAVATLLKYASKNNLQVKNIDALLQKSYAAISRGYPAVFINFCRYFIDKTPNVIPLLEKFTSGALSTGMVYEILANADALRIDSTTIHNMVAAFLSQQYYPGTFTQLDSKIFDKFLRPFVANELKNKSGYAVPMLQYCVDNGIALDDERDIPDLIRDALFTKKEESAEVLLKYSAKNKVQLNVSEIGAAIVSNNLWGIVPIFLKYVDATTYARDQAFDLTELTKKIMESKPDNFQFSDVLDFVGGDSFRFDLQECLSYARSLLELQTYVKQLERMQDEWHF